MPKIMAVLAWIIAASTSQAQAQGNAGQPSPSGQTAQAAAAAQPIVVKQTRKVCRSEVPTGSLIAKRICRTESELVQERAAGQALIEDLAREQVNMETRRAVQGR